jgi:hypothetical protein
MSTGAHRLGKIKAKLSLCLTTYYTIQPCIYLITHHAMKKAQLLNLCIIGRSVVAFTPQPLYCRGENPRYSLDRKLAGWTPQLVWTRWRRKKSLQCPCRESNLHCPARSLDTTMTALPQLPFNFFVYLNQRLTVGLRFSVPERPFTMYIRSLPLPDVFNSSVQFLLPLTPEDQCSSNQNTYETKNTSTPPMLRKPLRLQLSTVERRPGRKERDWRALS